jgi:hypothetical protein
VPKLGPSSRCLPVVVVQNTPKPFSAVDDALQIGPIDQPLDQFVVQPLVVALQMVALRVFIKQNQAAVGSVPEQTEKTSIVLQEQNRGSTCIANAAEKVRELSQHVKMETNEQSDGNHRGVYKLHLLR